MQPQNVCLDEDTRVKIREWRAETLTAADSHAGVFIILSQQQHRCCASPFHAAPSRCSSVKDDPIPLFLCFLSFSLPFHLSVLRMFGCSLAFGGFVVFKWLKGKMTSMREMESA
ncbi:hypothetical protein NQZ68_022534 [Dissostichus eleginoides]|nr:hypothetical protein NQZ68_022534 [Dissostichus eleginoides]